MLAHSQHTFSIPDQRGARHDRPWREFGNNQSLKPGKKSYLPVQLSNRDWWSLERIVKNGFDSIFPPDAVLHPPSVRRLTVNAGYVENGLQILTRQPDQVQKVRDLLVIAKLLDRSGIT